MSASTKKKLRSAERAEKLTQNQLAEQKEAKKLKIYTTAFVVVMALMLCFAIVITTIKTVENSGIRERNSTALTLNDQQINSVELNYYFLDSVNAFYNQYGSYVSLLGLDPTIPLDEQYVDEEAGLTWADDFMNSAVENIKAVHALNNAATEAGFTLSEEELESVETEIATMELYAIYNFGYPDLQTYLKTLYGNGADEESYRNYLTMNFTADAFQNKYLESLTYEDADLRAMDAENHDAYTSYSYNYYYLPATSFIEGEDKTNYTDEQYAAAVALAEKHAKELAANVTTVAEFDAAVAALPINEGKENVASTANNNVLHSAVSSVYAEWVTDDAREAGNIDYIPNVTTSTDEAGKETTKTNGYYVVMFNERNDNTFALANVRHILVSFEGGTVDETGVRTYSDAEKQTAKQKAEELLNTWKSGAATEESFAELANTNSSDSDGTDGGLYTDIVPGQMVANFNDWCFDESRKPGDTGIVETEYGCHVMYYSADSDLTYRDSMIIDDLKVEDLNEWYLGLSDAMTATVGDTKYVRTDLVIGSN